MLEFKRYFTRSFRTAYTIDYLDKNIIFEQYAYKVIKIVNKFKKSYKSKDYNSKKDPELSNSRIYRTSLKDKDKTDKSTPSYIKNLSRLLATDITKLQEESRYFNCSEVSYLLKDYPSKKKTIMGAITINRLTFEDN